MDITVEIANPCSDWDLHKEINTDFVRQICYNILCRFKNLSLIKEVEISILLADDAEITELNSKFRSKNKPTNVLSFPDQDLNWKRLLEFKPNLDYMYLGDVAFSYDTIKHESISLGKSFIDHFTHLLVHSILHLLGFDHEKDSDADAMEALEIEILKDFAIESPY